MPEPVIIELLALAERRGLAPGHQLAWPEEEVTEWYLLQQGIICCTTLEQVTSAASPSIGVFFLILNKKSSLA